VWQNSCGEYAFSVVGNTGAGAAAVVAAVVRKIGGGMEYLARTVRVEDTIISDQERNYGRRYAGRVEAFSSEPGRGGIKFFTVRLEDGEQLLLRPEEVRFL
jgi:hypothetical protein